MTGLFKRVDNTFISLGDTPITYSGIDYFFLKVNDEKTGVIFSPVDLVDIGITTASGHGGKFLFLTENEDQIDFKDIDFLDLYDTPATYSGYEGQIPVVNGEGTGLEFTTLSGLEISEEEKFCWRIKLAKLRPSLLYTATSNFTPSSYDVYPIVAHNWRASTTAEFEHGPGYPQTIVIKSGTAINFEVDGFMFYVKSTDVHSITDPVQNDAKREYFKRLKYIQNNNYKYITAWMAANGWNTQTISPGTYGSLLIGYAFNNIREFTIFNNTLTRHIYHGNLQTDGASNLGFSRHEDMFFIPIDVSVQVDVRAAYIPNGGGVYTVKYIDVPEWW